MNLNYFKYFITVAELGSFTEASEQLFITQPSLSVSIQKLEKNLGVKLLNRTKKGQKSSISLTHSGEHFLYKAKNILNQVESVKAELRHDSFSPRILKLGSLPTLPINFISGLVVNIRQTFPNITIEQVNGNSSELEDWLHRGNLDLAVTVFLEEKESLKISQKLFQQSYLAAIAEDHPLAKKASLSIEDLNQVPYIDRMGCEIRNYLQKVFVERDICPEVICRTENNYFSNSLIASGAGLAVIPDQIKIPGVITLPFSDLSITRSVGLQWRCGISSEIIDLFRDFSASDWGTPATAEVEPPSGSLVAHGGNPRG